MTWLTPMLALIAGAIAAPILVVLYLLKLRRREVEVSSTFLWDAVIRDMRANAPFQMLRKNILLLLQALALALAILALAQPGFMGERAAAGTTIILIDHSASMGATEQTPEGEPTTRLANAKRAARTLTESIEGNAGLGSNDANAMIISFAGSPTVLAQATTDLAALRAALESIEPVPGPAKLAPAIQIAEAHARDNPGETRIVVLSDGAFADDTPPSAPQDAELQFVSVGSSDTPNLGIVALRAEREYDQPDMVTVFASVEGTPAASDTAGLELSIDGEVVAVRDVALSAIGESQARSGAVVIRLRRLGSAVIRARLLAEDALALDNRAWVTLPPASRARTTVVTTGNPLLERALRATAIAPPAIITPAQYIERARAGSLSTDVVIFENFSPPADALPPGAYLSFGPPPPIEGVSAEGPVQESVAAFVNWNESHPVLQYAGLESIRAAKSTPLAVDDARDVIARLTTGPGIVELKHQGRRALCVAFDPLDSNWPFDRGYVLFLATAIDYLAGSAGAQSAQQIQLGETLSAILPAGTSDIRLTDPAGEPLDPTVRGSQVTFGPIESTGVFELSWTGAISRGDERIDGRAVRRIAASALDTTLTALPVSDRLQLAENTSGVTSTTLAESVPRSLRNWFVAGFLLLILFEWYIYHRKVQI